MEFWYRWWKIRFLDKVTHAPLCIWIILIHCPLEMMLISYCCEHFILKGYIIQWVCVSVTIVMDFFQQESQLKFYLKYQLQYVSVSTHFVKPIGFFRLVIGHTTELPSTSSTISAIGPIDVYTLSDTWSLSKPRSNP